MQGHWFVFEVELDDQTPIRGIRLKNPPYYKNPPLLLAVLFQGGILKSFCPPQAENFGILGIGIYRNPFEFDHFGGPNRSQNEENDAREQ